MGGTTRFALGSANWTCNVATTLINGASTGTYPGRPALSEDAQYPMANLKINDRAAFWRSASALTGAYNVEFDLGADRSIDVLAVHGFRWAAGQFSPPTALVTYRTSAQGYSSGLWTSFQTMTMGPRDVGMQLVAPFRGRYVRFAFNVAGAGGGFSVGNFYLGPMSYDLGVISSPNLVDRYLFARVRDHAQRSPILTQLGDDGRAWVLPFVAKDDRKAILDAVALASTPTTYLNQDNEIFQVVGSVEEYERTLTMSPPNRWSVALELERLP